MRRSLGHYRLLRELGRGGMGEVYLAVDTRLGRRVALKVLPEALASDSQKRRRLEREACAAAALNHPGIVTLHALEEADGIRFLTMEYVEGKTLSATIPEGGLPLQRLLSFGRQLAAAVGHAHAAGIVHRDLKPSNVVLAPGDLVKVCDFGLARRDAQESDAATASDSILAPGAVVGTVPYMSPEQTEGKKADARSDVFSLGTILYEMASGQRPFRGGTLFAVVMAIVGSEPEPLVKLRPELPEELAAIIERCLSKPPEERYPNAVQLASALESIALERTPHSQPGGLAARNDVAATTDTETSPGLARSGQRDRSRETSGEIDSLAVLPFENTSSDPDMDYLGEGLAEALINSLSGLRDLRVVPRVLSFAYKSRDRNPLEAGKELKVRAVLIGRVAERGGRLLIGAELLDVDNVSQLWGGRYDEDPDNLLSVQADLQRAIARKLRSEWSSGSHRASLHQGTQSQEAYRLYLKASYFGQRWGAESLNRAVDYARQALECDPAYAAAYARLAEAYAMLGYFAFGRAADVFPRARAAARRALELDDGLAAAHAALALVRTNYEWDFEAAEQEARRAVELDPDEPSAHLHLSLVLAVTGRGDDSVAEARRALELDPLSPVASLLLGTWLMNAHRYEEAIEELRRALELEPGLVRTYEILSNTLILAGRFEEALETIEAMSRLPGGAQLSRHLLGQAYARMGRLAEGRQLLEEVKELARDSPRFLLLGAFLATFLGEADQAFELLDRAVEERFPTMIWLATAPGLDELRSDPRFPELVRRVGPQAS